MALSTMFRRTLAVTRSIQKSSLYDWLVAASAILDNITGGGTQGEVRYVNTLGNDASGDGSFNNPFLTIQAALNSITDATAAKPYTVRVEAGVYATAFLFKPNCYIIGAGAGTSQYAGTPLVGATVVAPTAAQCLDPTFAGAGVKGTGITGCAFSTALLADFAAIASTGEGTFLVQDCSTDFAVTFRGNSVSNFADVRGLRVNVALPVTVTNMGGSDITGLVNDFGGGLTYTQSAAIQGFHIVAGSSVNVLTLTWTSALQANILNVTAIGRCANNNPVVSGTGAQLIADGSKSLAMADAAAQLSFGNNAAGTLIGVSCATNIVQCTPTANRVLTITTPVNTTLATRILVRNLSTAFVIDLTLTGGTIAAGSPTYVPPSSEVEINFDERNSVWLVKPYVQAGTAVLTNGVSAAIAADVTANSRIDVTWKASNGAAGVPLAPAAGRTVGTRVGGGSFVIHSAALVTGADVATDQGTYDWHICNNGG